MTVIDAFLDRPKVVPKHKIPFGNRKRKSFESRPYMPEVEGCIVGGNLLPSTPPNNPFSMEENAAKPDADAQLFKKENEEEGDCSSPTLRKQKILVKSSRTPVRNRRKSRWKLKFHHQALPPEYLRHYKQQERKRRQSETRKSSQGNGANRKLVRKTEKKVFSTGPKKKVQSSDAAMVKTEVESFNPEEKLDGGSEGNVLEDLSPSTPSSPSPPGPPRDPKQPERKRSPFTVSRSLDNPFQSSLSGLGHLNIDVSQNKAFLENLLTNQIEINRVVQKDRKIFPSKTPQLNRFKAVKHEDKQKTNAIPPTGKIMNYSDLPYMGEITLDGIKPRRGRKPKKADICHLIYKNYGQVFPGAPGKDSEPETPKKHFKWRPETTGNHLNSSQRTKGLSENVTPSDRPDSPLPTVTGLINHSEVQNRIINSLLEKRLTQEMRLKTLPARTDRGGCDEPLNLCIRDLKSLKIKLSRKHGNVYETRQKDATTTAMAASIFKTSQVKQEPEEETRPELIRIDKTDSEPETSDENDEEDDLAPFNLVTTELRESSDEETLLNLGDQITLTRVKSPGRKRDIKTPESTASESPSPMLFWPPPASLFLPGLPPSPLPKYSNIPEILTSSNTERKPSRTSSEGSRTQMKRVASNSTSSKPAHVITKRKRSAIFIPPVPAESTTNPTTEVSICKFKFTGGAKPSLQEKKMLSVDSGGNFRYYSGTGDKSMRGYEYFPRESLQQCQENTGCSPSGVFLTASALGTGEKIPEEIGHSGFFDSDFPLRVSGTKIPDKKLKMKAKKTDGGKEGADSTCYKTLREHLLSAKGENPESGTNLEDTDRDDGNSSDQSDRDFDLRAIPQCYLDTFKVHDETSRSSGKSGENSSRHRRLRKTRKSIAREKLEQTFKEKGFLIQTQQLESAEGATYCKFRQLRKFTRYLFRSWKDYLPGNVRNLSVDAGVDNPEMIMHIPEMNVKAEVSDFEGTESFK